MNPETLVSSLSNQERDELLYSLVSRLTEIGLLDHLQAILTQLPQQPSEDKLRLIVTTYIFFDEQYKDMTIEEAIEAFKESFTFESCQESYDRIMELLSDESGRPPLAVLNLG